MKRKVSSSKVDNENSKIDSPTITLTPADENLSITLTPPPELKPIQWAVNTIQLPMIYRIYKKVERYNRS